MLCELHISDVAIIDHLQMEFGEGLHVISGETGAGKSIILDALGLILGGRGDVGLIREGSEEARVEARFQLDDAPWMAATLTEVGLEPEAELIVRRTLSRSGRGRIHVNGSLVTAATLRRLAAGLVDFSSQNEQQVLLDPARHLEILDIFGGHDDALAAMADASASLSEVVGRLRALDERQTNRAEREAFLRFQLDELTRIDPTPGEDDELEAERRRMTHAEKLHANAKAAEGLLYSGRGAVVESLGEAQRRLRLIVDIDPSAKEMGDALESALIQVEDVARSLSGYARRIEFSPHRMEEVNSRLEELASLKRKYRSTLGEILERRRSMVAELGTLETFEEEREGLVREVAARRAAAEVAAQALTELRLAAARRLAEAVEAELSGLNMAKARFEPRVERRPEAAEIGPRGWDRVEFYLSANPGETARPMSKVASGGELSRILLGLKCALAGAGDVGTFIFDEIDAGIGGATAEVVGQKLRRISRHHQVITITHLPQIAAYGQRHFNVVKEIVGERTLTRVEVLSPERRVEELARMLGGLRITQTTRDHALELIERGQASHPNHAESSWPAG